MKVFLDGWHHYQISDISDDELEGIRRMISSACLNERRQFNDLKQQIEHIKDMKK